MDPYFPGGSARAGQKRMFFCFLFYVCVFCHSTAVECLKIWIIFFFSSLHDIFPSCAYVQVVYVFISIVQSIFLSIILPFCHWWPLRPKTQLIEHCHVKQLGDIFESIITHKFSALYKNELLNLGVNILVCALKHHLGTEMWPRPLLSISAWNWIYAMT